MSGEECDQNVIQITKNNSANETYILQPSEAYTSFRFCILWPNATDFPVL
jgi:hypothetical protein